MLLSSLGLGMCVLRPVKGAEVAVVWQIWPHNNDVLRSLIKHNQVSSRCTGWKHNVVMVEISLLMFGNRNRGGFRPSFQIKLNAMQVKEQNANTSVYVLLIAGIQRKCVYFCPRSVPGSVAPIFSSHALLLIWDFWLSSESEGLTAQRYMSQTGRNSLFFFKTPGDIDLKKRFHT